MDVILCGSLGQGDSEPFSEVTAVRSQAEGLVFESGHSSGFLC